MKKRYVAAIIGAIIIGSLTLSGCSSSISPAVPEVVKVQNVDRESENIISLNSKETVEVTPDMAKLTFVVLTEDEEADKCQQDNTERLNQLIEYLKQEGVEEKSIKTSGFSLDPNYSWDNYTQTLIGYEMRTEVEVNDISIDKTGALLSGAVANGANEILDVSYYSSQYDEAYAEALKKAVELARGKAEALASASQKNLGEVISINEYSDYQAGRYVSSNYKAMATGAMEDGAMAETASSMDVMPGEMQISAQISIKFRMVDETDYRQ